MHKHDICVQSSQRSKRKCLLSPSESMCRFLHSMNVCQTHKINTLRYANCAYALRGLTKISASIAAIFKLPKSNCFINKLFTFIGAFVCCIKNIWYTSKEYKTLDQAWFGVFTITLCRHLSLSWPNRRYPQKFSNWIPEKTRTIPKKWQCMRPQRRVHSISWNSIANAMA